MCARQRERERSRARDPERQRERQREDDGVRIARRREGKGGYHSSQTWRNGGSREPARRSHGSILEIWVLNGADRRSYPHDQRAQPWFARKILSQTQHRSILKSPAVYGPSDDVLRDVAM